MGFRFRLASFLVATLVLVQVFTALLVYGVTRRELVHEGKRHLALAGAAFSRQLLGTATRLSDSVEVLAQDSALRSAVAQHDQDALASALRNHGRRVGASRMLLLDLDGVVRADSAGAGVVGAPFHYPALFQRALQGPAAMLAGEGAQVYWQVLAPVRAPDTIALLAAQIPVDDAMLAWLRSQSALPHEIELVVGARGGWTLAARGSSEVSLAPIVTASRNDLPTEPALASVSGHDYVTLAQPLNVAPESSPVAVVLGYSLDDALRPYRAVGLAWGLVLALGLVAALVGAVLIARGVSRPIENLAMAARRIAAGDYGTPTDVKGSGEVGELGAALTAMTRAIGEREERLRHQAGHDAVTGLMSRVAAEVAIQRSLDADPTRPGAMLLIGLSRLPEITKTMGHAISDRLMRHAAERLRGAAGGIGMLARAADNELAVWLPGAERNGAISTAFRILQVLSEPWHEAGIALESTPLAGIALSPSHGTQASTLLQRAEVALFGASVAADAVSVYDPATDPHRPERLVLMSDLRGAVERDELRLHYQPRLNLATGLIDGAEGLVRWQHPQRGAIPPDAFIRLAEETGNIRRLTRWVLSAGVSQAQKWGEQQKDIRVAINVSARDLDDTDLPRRVSELLSVHRVPARLLTVELTESALMVRPEAALQVLRGLGELGVDLAIDDFGVGQSSFAYLHRLPVRELKIDRTFIKDLARNLEDQAIVRSVIELGHRLNYHVTAEGVEDAAALEFLIRLGCDHAQGWHIAKAMPAVEFDEFLLATPFEASQWGSSRDS